MEISPKTKISMPISAVWASIVFLVGATVFLFGVYAESRTTPEEIDSLKQRVSKIETNISEREQRERLNCLILQRIQKTIVPENYRIEAECK